jgi:hypothetical protein
MALTFVLGDDEPLTLGDEDAQWLVGELMAADDASVELAREVQYARFSRQPVQTTDVQRRKLLAVLNRSSRLRSHELRALEIARHAAVSKKPPSHPPA